LHQIGLAAHNYASAYGVLPPGLNTTTQLGSLAYILPYIEQDNIAKTMANNQTLANQYPNWYYQLQLNSQYAAAVATRIKTYECPSDPGLYGPIAPLPGTAVSGTIVAITTNGGGIGITYYPGALPQGPGTGGTFYFGPKVGCTNYCASAGALGKVGGFYGTWVGPFYANSTTRITDVKDGTSNTIAYGEILGGTTVPNRDFVDSWAGAGAMPTAWDFLEPSQWYTFGSAHNRVVNVAMCDGSVRSVTKAGNTTDWYSNRWYTLQIAAGQEDGSEPAASLNWSLIGF
jgi:prepilin-type processing-associated H-X9-DG protein